jgi:hypothetical protein
MFWELVIEALQVLSKGFDYNGCFGRALEFYPAVHTKKTFFVLDVNLTPKQG